MSRWYAAKILASGEPLALRNLAQQGYETFSPRISRHVRHARRTTVKQAPLFPGYLFVKINLMTTRWRPVDSTPGVCGLVKFGGVPAPLPAGLVERLQELTSASGELTGLQASAGPGDTVRILGGAWDNWIGEVLSVPDAHRIILLIEMASRHVTVSVPRASALLVAASAPAGQAPGLAAGSPS